MSDAIYRVWCISWEDHEDNACMVRGYDPITEGWKDDNSKCIHIAFTPMDAGEAAERYAEWCHSHRDGWEASWPLVFRVLSPDGTLTDFSVDRESRPIFAAHEVGRPRREAPEAS